MPPRVQRACWIRDCLIRAWRHREGSLCNPIWVSKCESSCIFVALAFQSVRTHPAHSKDPPPEFGNPGYRGRRLNIVFREHLFRFDLNSQAALNPVDLLVRGNKGVGDDGVAFIGEMIVTGVVNLDQDLAVFLRADALAVLLEGIGVGNLDNSSRVEGLAVGSLDNGQQCLLVCNALVGFVIV